MDLNNKFNNQIQSKKYNLYVEDFCKKYRLTTGGVIVKKSAAVKKYLGRFRGPSRHSLHTACEKTTYKDCSVPGSDIWRWHNGRKGPQRVMDMALSGVNYCKSTVVDIKKQNNRPIFQPTRLLSTAASTMNHSKNMDFPFVQLTGHKLVNDPCIPTNFDIVNDHTNFGDFVFGKGNTFTKTSFKGCNQFPVFSISQLVGGFVGSKSQLRTESRESHQIWDIVFKKLDEFINSRTTERYSQQHCYGFQELSHNIFESLYEKTNPTLGLAASYILADGCQSIKNTKNIESIVKSSPPTQNAAQIIPTAVDTTAQLGSFVPSHSPCNKSTVPVICEIVEHLVSQPDLIDHNISVGLPLEVGLISAGVGRLVPASVSCEPSVACDNPSEGNLKLDSSPETQSPVLTEGKQSYAEVAKMAQAKSKIGRPSDRRITNGLMSSSSKQYRNINNHKYSRNCRDPRQRGVDSSNWRSEGAYGVQKGLKRDANQGHSSVESDVSYWKCDQDLKPGPSRISQGHRRKNHEGLKHFRNFKGSTLKTVPEMASNTTTKHVVNGAKPLVGPTFTAKEYSCHSYNVNKRPCMNWRCRQHVQKSSVKQNMKHVLNDNEIGENLDDRTTSGGEPSSPNDESATAIKLNTLENYIKPTIPPNPSPGRNNTLRNLKQTHCDFKSGVQSLPIISTNDESMGVPVFSKDGFATDSTRLSENCYVVLPPVIKERLSSESSDSNKSAPRSRSISEESRASTSSTSSVNSCKPLSEANLRRRFSSECDSEDSFVVFEGGVDCVDYDLDSLLDSSDEGSDLESDDECDSASPRVSMVICFSLQSDDDIEIVAAQSPKMQEANAKWKKNCTSPGKKPSCKKVHFASSPCLATVHPMVKWDYAYRTARCGPWEEMARDRERFKQRVERSESIIAPVLEAAHRSKVAALLHDAGRHDVPTESKLR